MTLNQFKKSQSEALREFKNLRENNPAEARNIARKNLFESGIIDKRGYLNERYR